MSLRPLARREEQQGRKPSRPRHRLRRPLRSPRPERRRRGTSAPRLATSLTLHAADPVAPGESKHPASETAVTEHKKEIIAIKVMLEREGKELASYTAYGSPDSNDKEIYCVGVVLSEDRYWRVSVNADLRGIEQSRIHVDVEDLALPRMNSVQGIVPIEIFTVEQQSVGLGQYLLGEVQGLTLKVEFSKAEMSLPKSSVP